MVNLLELDSVIKRYGEKLILSDIYLSIRTSQIVAVFGDNGSGKSTLFKILYGIEPSENHSIRLNKKPIDKPFKLNSVLNYSAQDIFLPKSVSAKDILKIFYNGKIPNEVIERFHHLFKTKVGNLSGGEQKLLQLYMILSSNSKFVILDEPFNHLSPLMIEEVKNLIREKSKTMGIILSDHSYRDVLDISNELYLLKNAKLTKIASQTELSDHGYIQSKNSICPA